MHVENIITNHRFYVITGGPGAGKTSLLDELNKQNFKCIPEVAREIIIEQMKSGGDAVPWKNTELYKQIMMDRSVETYYSASFENNEISFFDRGIPDTISYARLLDSPVSKEFDLYAKSLRYNRKVFILPPWQEIYETDSERKQSWEEAVMTYEVLKDTYISYEYELIEIPKIDILKRAEFILQYI